MKNFSLNHLLLPLLSSIIQVQGACIPASPESARANPFIIPYSYTQLTTITAKIGAYPHKKNLINRATTFFETKLTQNITKSLFIGGTILLPHKGSQLESTLLQNSGSLVLGNTYSYQKTKKFDFINTLLASGFAILPAKRKNRLALPLTGALEWGLFDWITIGIREDLLFGYGKDLSVQNNIMTYLHADQPIRGLSIFVGFSNTYQTSSYQPYRWKLYTIHLALGLDLATNYNRYLPSCSLFCDYALGSTAATCASHRMGLRMTTIF